MLNLEDVLVSLMFRMRCQKNLVLMVYLISKILIDAP